MNLLHSRKFRILLAIVAFVVLWPLILKGIYYLQAPKFKAIHYQSTEQTYGCLWVITDAGCDTTRYYKATGSEREIIVKLITELEQKGYKLGEKNGYKTFSCGLYRINGDQYSFEKSEKGYQYPAVQYVNFFLPSHTHPISPDEPAKIGCDNFNGDYEIELSGNGPQN